MFARVTPYKMKPGSRDAVVATMERLKDRIMGMPGMHHFINVMNDDGSGYVVAVVESRETSDANSETVKALWSEFSEYLETMPTPQGFDVMANWGN